MKNKKTAKIAHISFDVGLIIKAFDALAEIIGGIVLIFLSPDKLNMLIARISKGELTEDPTDFLMNYLVTFGHGFSISSWQFVMFYLLSHGIIKMVVILMLWKKKLWAYPLSAIVFALFIVYQIYHYTASHSVFLLLLTVLDIIMIVLTLLEYKRIKRESKV